MPELGHPCLPHQAIIWVHTVCNIQSKRIRVRVDNGNDILHSRCRKCCLGNRMAQRVPVLYGCGELGPGFLPFFSSSTTTLSTYVVCYTHVFSCIYIQDRILKDNTTIQHKSQESHFRKENKLPLHCFV